MQHVEWHANPWTTSNSITAEDKHFVLLERIAVMPEFAQAACEHCVTLEPYHDTRTCQAFMLRLRAQSRLPHEAAILAHEILLRFLPR